MLYEYTVDTARRALVVIGNSFPWSQRKGFETVSQYINPHHLMPAHVAEGLRSYRERKEYEAGLRNEFTRLERPSEVERSSKAEARKSALKAAGVDIERARARASDLREARTRWTQTNDPSVEQQDVELIPIELSPAVPVSTDPSFWAAETRWFGTAPFAASFEADGLHFTGLLNHDSGNLGFYNFGYVSSFAISPDRLPASPSGRWRSAPHIEIFNQLIGSSQDSFGFGDDWCKCWMVRRQTAFQFVFAPPGASNRHIIGERVDVQTIFFSEDAPFTQFWGGPGFQSMPELILTHPFSAQDIWVDLEVRFDIQLEGSSQLWIAHGPVHHLLLRGFQWPAEPV